MTEPTTVPTDEFRAESGAFVMVPLEVVEAHLDGALELYCVLAHYGGRGGRSWPSRSTLAERMDCSPDTVDRRVKALMAAGFLTVENRGKSSGGRTSNLYILRVRRFRKTAEGSRKSAVQPSRKNAAGTREVIELEADARGNETGAARSPNGGGARQPGENAYSGYRTAAEIRADLEAVEVADPEVTQSAIDDARRRIGRP